MNDSPSPKHELGRWRKVLLVLLLVCVVICIGLWFLINGRAKSELNDRLVQLGLGEPVVGSVRTSLSGVVANDVSFAADEAACAPAVQIDRLAINHSLAGLVAGTSELDSIRLEGATVRLPLELLSAQKSGWELDLGAVQLPAKTIEFKNAAVILFAPGQRDFTTEGIDISLTQTNGAVKVSGQVRNFVGGNWKVAGHLHTDERNEPTRLMLRSESLQITDGQWQRLPLLPARFEKWVRGAGEADVSFELTMDQQQSVAINGAASVKRLKLTLPTFDLPIEISSGELQLDNDALGFENVHASIDGTDHVKVAGSVRTAAFPVVVDFKSSFEKLSVKSIRKLVADLPNELSGTANGIANGSVQIDAGTSCRIDVKSTATADAAAYGEIQSDEVNLKVDIKSLQFDQEQHFKSVGGSVTVVAAVRPQPLTHIINTFELDSLNQQLELAGNFAGTANLSIPLATAQQINTWQLGFIGSLPSATVGDQPLSQVDVRGGLSGNDLVFESIRGVPISDQNQPNTEREIPFLDAKIRWPLFVQPGQGGDATVSLSGCRVPTEWLVAFMVKQQANAKTPVPADVEPFIQTLRGSINLSGQLQLPPLQPDDLKQWNLEATITDSGLKQKNLSLRELSANVGLIDGILKVDDVSGLTSIGGAVSGTALFDLFDSQNQAIKLTASELPAAWLSRLLIDQIPAINPTVNQPSTSPEGPLKLEGNLAIGLAYEREPEQPAPVATIEARSESILANQVPLKDVQLSAQFSNNELQLKKLTASLSTEDFLDGQVQAVGRWNSQTEVATGQLEWRSVPNATVAKLGRTPINAIGGSSNGSLRMAWNEVLNESEVLENPANAFTENELPLQVFGNIQLIDLAFGSVRLRDVDLAIVTRERVVYLENADDDSLFAQLNLTARTELSSNLPFEIAADFSDQRLSQWLRRATVSERAGLTSEITGVANGTLKLSGQLLPFQWQTSGIVHMTSLRVNEQKLSDFQAKWDHNGDDWKDSAAVVEGFGGKISLVELTTQPERVQLEFENLDSQQLTSIWTLPLKLTGSLDGKASLNNWTNAEKKSAELTLTGSSILIGQAELGDFEASAEYRAEKLNYDLSGSLLSGKLNGKGTTQFQTGRIAATKFPLSLELRNASLDRLYGSSNMFRSLQPLQGALSANTDFVFHTDGTFEADGRTAVNELKWNNKLVTRSASIHLGVAKNQLFFDDVRVDLKTGSIVATASVPLDRKSAGNYDLDIRQLDLKRLSEIVSGGDHDLVGRLDARINGRLGSNVDGQGYVGVRRAKIGALAGQSLRVPIQFRLDPLQSSGHIELRRSTFRLFDGRASGKATIHVGPRLNLEADLKLSNVDTGKLFSAVVKADQANQGTLNGRLILKGNGIRNVNDLKGSFNGTLDRAAALQFPILTNLTRFFAGNGLGSQVYDSDEIKMELNRGRIEIKQFNFYNSLAKIAVTGDAFLDGRLNLGVVARIDQLNQPTLLNQLTGSRLSALSGNPVSFFAEATDFLSDRVLFFKVGGTLVRPQVRLDSSQQIREETIRYFLRGSQILPNQTEPNN